MLDECGPSAYNLLVVVGLNFKLVLDECGPSAYSLLVDVGLNFLSVEV